MAEARRAVATAALAKARPTSPLRARAIALPRLVA